MTAAHSRAGFTTSLAGPVREQPHPSSARRALATTDGPAGGRGGPVRGHPRAGYETASSPRAIRLGVSACLVGDHVRYDGGHKRDPYLINLFGPFVEWV